MEVTNDYQLPVTDCRGMFTTLTVNECLERAAAMPTPRRLFESLWFENEVACLFADTNMGKSIFAVQIGSTVAQQGHSVMYFDFELTDKQFQMRYVSDDGSEMSIFNDNFYRVSLKPDAMMRDNVAEIAMAIEAEARAHGSHVVIIDNITWLCNGCENGDAAGELMQQLVRLKKDYGLSILVLAHTPKRSQLSPLTQNSLAGSKRLANFMDSIFALGKDHTVAEGNGRYLKQIKVRSDELRYGENNVVRYVIEKEGPALMFIPKGFATEREMLTDPEAGSDNAARRARIGQLQAEGRSMREIAQMLNVNVSTVSRILSGAIR